MTTENVTEATDPEARDDRTAALHLPGSAARPSKVAVIGAGGVGATLAYALVFQGVAREVVLYDVNRDKVRAEAMDIAHGIQFAPMSTVDGSDDIEICRDADVVVITAGAKQKPGQTRIELAATNAKIMGSLMEQLLQVAPDAVYVIVTNPCDVLTMLAQEASGLPVERVFASGTVLDSSRLRWEIARRAHVAEDSVHAQIVGEHGDTEFPYWSGARIGTVPVQDWTRDGQKLFSPELMETIGVDVRDAAYKVIQGKGATNHAIGLSSARIVEAILGDEQAILPVAPVLQGEHGISDAALSVPCIVGAEGARPIPETPFSEDELSRLQASADALKKVAADLRG